MTPLIFIKGAASFVAENWKAIAVAGLMFGAWWMGRDGAQKECQAADAARQAAAAETYQKAVGDIRDVAGELRQAIKAEREETRVIEVATTKEIQRVEYRCPVPQTGIDLYNRAAAGGLRD